MDGLYNQTLHQLDKAFKRLEAMVPPPQRMPFRDSFAFRYQEKTIHQAIIQKLARTVSGLRAAWLLCDNGLFQEQGAIQRMLDEFHDDIWFLAFALINNEITPLHQEYLDAFYKEEFDPTTGEPFLDRPMSRRQKIRAYLSNIEQQPKDPSSAVTLYHTLHSGYSGFVHGASPHIMDMVIGDPPRFHIHGMAGTPRHETHRDDLYNPFFRAIISFAIAAKAFGDEDLCHELNNYHLEFDKLAGRNNAYRPERAHDTPSAQPRRAPHNS